MPTFDCEGQAVRIDEDGYLLDGTQWTPAVADELARASGIAPLTDRHWKIIALCREDQARRRRQPDMRRLSRLAHVAVDELDRLFLDRASQLIPKIAGLSGPAHDRHESHEQATHGGFHES